MFRSKKDVDRHVQDIFRKLKNDNEVWLVFGTERPCKMNDRFVTFEARTRNVFK